MRVSSTQLNEVVCPWCWPQYGGFAVGFHRERHCVNHVLVLVALDVPRSVDHERDRSVVVGGPGRLIGVLIGNGTVVADGSGGVVYLVASRSKTVLVRPIVTSTPPCATSSAVIRSVDELAGNHHRTGGGQVHQLASRNLTGSSHADSGFLVDRGANSNVCPWRV